MSLEVQGSSLLSLNNTGLHNCCSHLCATYTENIQEDIQIKIEACKSSTKGKNKKENKLYLH